MTGHPFQVLDLPRRIRARMTLIAVVLLAAALMWLTYGRQAKGPHALFYSTPAQWAELTAEPVQQREFQSDFVTEGKVAVDEDRSTPIFSPYAGRIMKLLVKPGDVVRRGQPLFTIEATDMVQAQNDFIAGVTALNKARSALNLAQIIDKRQRLLYDAKAVPLKEVQNARGALDAAENDVRSSEVALEAARNRLRILGKTDHEIETFEHTGAIDPATPISAPIAGTIVQRKAGPGQYIGSGASDPVFVIGDMSTVWLVALVREWDAPKVSIGQRIQFTVLAEPDRIYEAKITYAAAILDAASRRLFVRTTIDNPEGRLKPEMFANVRIFPGEAASAPAVPSYSVMYEGGNASVWVVHEDKTIELRPIKAGLTNGDMVQIIEGLTLGERVITKGSLFIDRVAAGG
jgi:membrane fusion protein, heavy metal efflux system